MIKPGLKPADFPLCGKLLKNGKTCGRAAGHQSVCRSRDSMATNAARQSTRYKTEPEYRRRTIAAQKKLRASRR